MSTSNGPQAEGSEPSQQKEHFFRYFQEEVTALQEQMDRLGSLAATGGERSDAADHCLAAIARLSNEVKDASVYLPAHDQRTYAQAIKALQEKLAETKASLAPRQRFTFKTARKNPSAVSLSDAAELALSRGYNTPGYHSSPGNSSTGSSLATTPNLIATPYNDPQFTASLSPATEAPWPDEEGEDHFPDQHPPTVVRRPTFTRVSTVSLSSQSHVYIIVPTAAAHATMPANLTRLKSSVVDISVPTEHGLPFASLTIKSIRTCLLVCGSVNGPAHITDVKDSVIVVNCRQFRMHDCQGCTVYLACSSTPVIEDCKGIRFGQYPDTYATPASAPQPTSQSTTTTSTLPPQSSSSSLTTSPPPPPPSSTFPHTISDFNNPSASSSTTTTASSAFSSPNFTVLAPSDHVSEEVWRDIASSGRGGGTGKGVKEILAAVGVPRTTD